VSAPAGQWAAATAREPSALGRFQASFERLYSVFPESGIEMCLWWGEAFRKGQYFHAASKVLAHRERLLKGFIWRRAGPSFGYIDAATNGSTHHGIPVSSRCRQLQGYSPEELFQRVITECETNSAGRPDFAVSHDIVFAWAMFGRALARQRHLERAQQALAAARCHLDKIEDRATYLTFLLKEVEIDACRAEWSLNRNPEVLVSCVKRIEDAANFADGMNLPNRASELRSLRLV
jgi:hypothetical protein